MPLLYPMEHIATEHGIKFESPEKVLRKRVKKLVRKIASPLRVTVI